MPNVKEVQIGLGPTGPSISGNIEVGNKERDAAWELYVELVTRISVVKLQPDEGLLREALSSYYTLFGSTRQILRNHGPDIAQAKGGSMSFGELAVRVLNEELRPVLAKWHPALEDHENKRTEDKSRLQHEKDWEHNQQLRDILEKRREVLDQYARVLADIADVDHLVAQEEKT